MNKISSIQNGLMTLFILLFRFDGFSQEGKDKYVGKYEAAYKDSNYVVELSIPRSGEYQISYQDDVATFINLEETNFRNAVMVAWGKKTKDRAPKDTTGLINIATIWFNQIMDKGIVGTDIRQRESIGMISFTEKNRKVPLLMRAKDLNNLMEKADKLKKLLEENKDPSAIENLEKELQDKGAEIKKNTTGKLDSAAIDLIKKVNFLEKHKRISKDHYLLDSLTIESVEIDFEDGAITELKARANVSDKIIGFERWKRISVRAPREIAALNTVGKHYLEKKIGKFKLYLDIAQVISFDRKLLSGSGTYIPENKKVELTTQSAKINLFKERFYDNFDIRFYTDLTGLGRDNPNGLVQIEGSYNIIFHNLEFLTTRIFPLNTLKPFATFSKIENKVRGQDYFSYS